MSICHFCHICCVLHMVMSSTCVLGYDMPSLQGCMPCTFVINVVTSTSMQSSSRDIADFRDLEFNCHFPAVIFMPCIHVATEWSMPFLSMFSKDNSDIWLCSIHPCPCFHLWSTLASMTQSCSTFAIKCSWQIVYVLIKFAKDFVVDPCMTWDCSCHGLLHEHVFLRVVCLSCHAMSCDEWIELANMPS